MKLTNIEPLLPHKPFVQFGPFAEGFLTKLCLVAPYGPSITYDGEIGQRSHAHKQRQFQKSRIKTGKGTIYRDLRAVYFVAERG